MQFVSDKTTKKSTVLEPRGTAGEVTAASERPHESSFRADFSPDGRSCVRTKADRETHSPIPFSARDESSGETLTPLSTVGALGMGAPVQAKKGKRYAPSAKESIDSRVSDMGEELKRNPTALNNPKLAVLMEHANFVRLNSQTGITSYLKADEEKYYDKMAASLSENDIADLISAQGDDAAAKLQELKNSQFAQKSVMGQSVAGVLNPQFVEDYSKKGAVREMTFNPDYERYLGYEELKKHIYGLNGQSARFLRAQNGEFGDMPPEEAQRLSDVMAGQQGQMITKMDLGAQLARKEKKYRAPRTKQWWQFWKG